MSGAEINVDEKYIPLFQGDTRYYIVTGGRGSGKSFAVNLFLNYLTYEDGHKVLFTRYTMTSAHTSIIPEFVDKIDLMGASDDFRVTRDEIINMHTQSLIMFKGIKTSSGNQTAALKSLAGVTTFVVDEAEELVDEEIFDKIDLSVRSNKNTNRVVLILNPTTKEHWIYKRFFEARGIEAGWNGVHTDTTYIHTTYKDNKGNLPDSFLHSIYEMKLKRPEKYEHQILGGWINQQDGAVYTNWKTGNYVELNKTCYGQDFGFSTDLTTLVKVSVDDFKREIYVKEIYGKAGMSTGDIAAKNKQYAGIDLIICDNHEPRLIKELKDYGVNIQPAQQKQGSILSGIALVQDYDIIVDRQSHGIIREFNNYTWKEKGTTPIDKYNHYLDALRYAVMFLADNKNKGTYVVR
jgi:phage terminase large subunit